MVGPLLLTLYGVGTTVGAGIYVLIGAVAGAAGMLAPWSFLLAAAVVALSAFSFGELAARIPRSASEAIYVQEGFGSDTMALIVGLMVAAAGMVSCATIVNGFVAYFEDFIALPGWLVIIGVIVGLGTVAAWGIGESVTLAAAITVIEVGGLLLVVGLGAGDAFAHLPGKAVALLPTTDSTVLGGVLTGAILAFYAFIGFEDMVNVAEEVMAPRRTMPMAIMATLAITALLYLSVALVAVLTVPPEILAASPTPLRLVFETVSGFDGRILSAIALIAVLNGALIQIIMASRVLYGLARQQLVSSLLGRVNRLTRTPVNATVLVCAIVLLAAQALPLVTLAKTTTYIALAIFATVDLALIRIKRRGPPPPEAFDLPLFVPALGALSTGGLLLLELIRVL